MRSSTRLQELLKREQTLATPLVHDALSARIAEQAGFEGVFIGGYGVSACFLGMPDAGFITLPELLTVARNIINAVQVPVIVDADTGFGNALNVRRTVRELIQAGAAGMLLEDQQSPKRSEFVAGIEVISVEEAIGKLRAAVDMRNDLDRDFVIIARTDSRVAVGGSLDEALRRGNAYADAGADVIFLAAPQSPEEIRHLLREIHAPAFCPLVEISPIPSLEEQQNWGMAMSLYGAAHPAAAKAVWDYFHALRQDGVKAQEAFREGIKEHPLEVFHEFIGFPEMRKLEEQYLPSEQVRRKYTDSVGYRPES